MTENINLSNEIILIEELEAKTAPSGPCKWRPRLTQQHVNDRRELAMKETYGVIWV